MRRLFSSAVTSMFLWSGAVSASDIELKSPWVLTSDASSLTFTLVGGENVFETGNFAHLTGEIDRTGDVEVDIALNAFPRTATLTEIRARYDALDGFAIPMAHLSADLTQAMLDHVLRGTQSAFDLPVKLELNGVTRQITGRVTGAMRGADRVEIRSHTPIHLSPADFELSDPESAAFHHEILVDFSFTFNAVEDEAEPLFVAITPQDGLAQSRRPTPRPMATRVAVTATKPRAQPREIVPVRQQKQIVTVTYAAPDKVKTPERCVDHATSVARARGPYLDGAHAEPTNRRALGKTLRSVALVLRGCP